MALDAPPITREREHMIHGQGVGGEGAVAVRTDTVGHAVATMPVVRAAKYGYAAWTLWLLGGPEQPQQCNYQILALAHALSHPCNQGVAWL
jgi:hypothetical protein